MTNPAARAEMLSKGTRPGATVNAKLKEISTPLVAGNKYCFELSSGEFVVIDLQENANGSDQWVVEHLSSTGEFVAGLQLEAS